MTQHAILVLHQSSIDSAFVFVMVMYGVASAIVGWLSHALYARTRKDRNEKKQSRDLAAALERMDADGTNAFPGEAWGTVLTKEIIASADFGFRANPSRDRCRPEAQVLQGPIRVDGGFGGGEIGNYSGPAETS